ncbi:glycosyltransferase family 87 protein [Tabrizicola sp.]|uniref:glycosyltransferase family 87 protein n=1 Tax=Tabrizicola sp. TaxID=2005166 RepID=UPI0035B33B4A
MQDLPSRLAADARILALQGRLLWLVVLAGVTVTVLFTQTILQVSFILTAEPATEAIKVDFRVFWAAAQLALQGEPLAAFDTARLGDIHKVDPGAFMPWLYPPGYLVALMPFGALSFSTGFLVFTLLSVLLMGLATRSLSAGSVPVWLAMTLAPAYVPTLIIGQNNLIWLAGLLAALAALRDGRWALAGIFIGCLTLKPQLGLLLPVALLAAGLWRSILVAIITAAILALVPTLMFGPEYWPLLAERLSLMGKSLIHSLPDLFLMVGPMYLMSLLGLEAETALRLQWGIVGLAAACVAFLWRSDRYGFDARVAGLMLAMLLSAPYLWYYEAAMMAPIGLFMTRAGILGRTPLQLGLLLCLWLGGLLLALNAFLDFADGRMLGAILITPVLTTSLILVLIHPFAARRSQMVVA